MQRKNKKPKKDFIEVENLEGETKEILGNTLGVEAPLAQKVAENSSYLRCGEQDILSRRLAVIVFVNAVNFTSENQTLPTPSLNLERITECNIRLNNVVVILAIVRIDAKPRAED